MKAITKFTFKTIKPTGRYKSFSSPTHYIKMGKKESVGRIENDTFKIRFMVIKDDINEDKNPNCVWKWITLKKDSKSLDEAKEFLNANFEVLTKTYNLYKAEI